MQRGCMDFEPEQTEHNNVIERFEVQQALESEVNRSN